MEIEIIIPPTASTDIDNDIVALTEYLAKKLDLESGGGLGGEFGYGVDFENDVFGMHPFCWCERDECRWCNQSYAPNFWHKPSGLEIHWYKWIGRSMRFSFEPTAEQWAEIFKSVLDSVGSGPILPERVDTVPE